MTSRRRLRFSTSHLLDVPVRLSTVGKRRFRFLVPSSGTTCLSTLLILCVNITFHHCCLETCGPCNDLHYLFHVKNVYDDDDGDISSINFINNKDHSVLCAVLKVWNAVRTVAITTFCRQWLTSPFCRATTLCNYAVWLFRAYSLLCVELQQSSRTVCHEPWHQNVSRFLNFTLVCVHGS